MKHSNSGNREIYKPRVLIIGPSQSVIEYRKGISSIVTNTMDSSLKNKFDLLHINTIKKGRRSGFTFANIWYTVVYLYKTFIMILMKKPVIVHIHTSGSWSFFKYSTLLLLSKMLKRKTITHIHDGTFDQFYARIPLKWLVKKLLMMSDIMITLTQSWDQFYRNTLGISNSHIVPNFVTADMEDSVPRYLENNRNVTSTVLFVGELTNFRLIKGIDTVLLSIPKVIAVNSDVSFLFAGEVKREKYETLCKEMGIINHVQFLGEVPYYRMKQIYTSSDIFILPSRAEGLPLAMLEAMMLGLPVVTTCIRGTRELIQDRVNGFIITPADHISLANSINILLADESLRHQMGRNNREKIVSEYSEEIVIDKMANLYSSLCTI